MGSIGPWQIVIILLLAVLLFGGGGKISSLMGDFAKGIKAFRKGLQDEDKKLEERADAAKDVTPAKDAEAHKAGQ
ncbi:MAG: twin-arginine translocase TatA/TatE family subunit [Pseudomonadota bacterium]|nr:twin-arginine translocase TatA/TatE family subunit [Pseudomonadota bacterium]